MKSRTKAYANRVVRLAEALPERWVACTLGKQLLRSGTSVAANYRAVCRAKSTSNFINKLRIVEEECDESLFWMELLVENAIFNESRVRDLMQEANENSFYCGSLVKNRPNVPSGPGNPTAA